MKIVAFALLLLPVAADAQTWTASVAGVEALPKSRAISINSSMKIRPSLKTRDVAVHIDRLRIDAGATLELLDTHGATVWALSGPFAMVDAWLPPVYDEAIVIRCLSKGAGATCEGNVDAFARGRTPDDLRTANKPRFESTEVCLTCGIVEVACESSDYVNRTIPAVARVRINGQESCTGFLVGGEGYFLTNRHCLAEPAAVAHATYEFGAEETACDRNCANVHVARPKVQILGGEYVDDDPRLDVMVLKLDPQMLGQYRVGLNLRASVPKTDENAFMIQHPRGESKKIAFDHIRVSPAAPCDKDLTSTVGYDIDSRRGSSGSPVLSVDDPGRVIAIHECSGCPNRGIPSAEVCLRFKAKMSKDVCVSEIGK